MSISGGSLYAGMWIETFGAVASGASGGASISRRGLRPKAIAAISSMRANAMMISGISSTVPKPSAKAAPGTK